MSRIEGLNEYQDLASRTAVFSKGAKGEEGTIDGLTYTVLGLNGEAGEVAEQVKKCIRDDKGFLTPERIDNITKEAGDVLWYLSQLARVLGITLEQVAEANIRKLESRNKRGKIHGEGDNR